MALHLGCSSFTWETEDGKHLLGRTYDQFGDLSGNRIVVVPEGFPVQLEVDRGLENPVPGRYGFCGMAVLGLDTPIMVDGINEQGLMGALLHYPEYAVYDTRKEAGSMDIHPGFLLTYLLSQCQGVEEVVQAMARINLTGELIFGQPMPVHYILSDRTGEAVILEPDAGGLRVHRKTIGVLTNSPDFGWHRTNLRNYTGVTNRPKEPQKIGDYEIREFGERLGGCFGLPGNYSSPSRFVRVAFLKEFAVKGRDEVDGVSRMFRVFASVDIPEGILRAEGETPSYEQTLCTSVACAESRTYYWSTAGNRRICALRLDRNQAGPGIVTIDLETDQDIEYVM